jgi:murein DD-endopeptidase MepM/ murein hydrolase activator NlpD
MGRASATLARSGRAVVLVGAALTVAACSQFGNPLAPSVGLIEASPPAGNLEPDSRGVITYATYQVAIAREGDTLETVASRVGTTSDELARRNSLPADYRLRSGEVLLLPDSVSRPAPVSSGFEVGEVSTETLGGTPVAGASPTGQAGNPFQNGQTEPLIDPVRHRVEAGETAYSIARLYGVSVTALASWNGLGPDLAVRENQELLIPIVGDANRISGAADSQPGQVTAVEPPSIAAEPLPADIAAAVAPESPQLGQFRTPPGGRLSPPVEGSVSRPYNAANPNGIGYAVPAGTPVRAAAGGEVALISEELDGPGTIVLIRHQDDLMTTYSTLADARVAKGDRVSAGQVIGTVAPRDRPELQFDVFRGTTSVDPTPYLRN